nr:ladderlectin isoform X1 [Syngnathus scovelli]
MFLLLQMAFAVHLLFLLCGINGLLTGVWPLPVHHWKNINCPSSDWIQVDCYCFLYQDTAASFVDAEAACIDLDANLASIRNNAENAIIRQLLVEDSATKAWIGLHDAIQDDDFIWTDGSFDNFRNFDSNNLEPNDSGDCVEINDEGLWQDEDCTTQNTYVCLQDLCNGGNRDNPDNCAE